MSSRAKACTIRIPDSPSWSVASVWPIRSRSVRYATFERRWKRTLDAITIGKATRHTADSRGDTIRIAISDPTSNRPFWTNISRPVWTSSVSASMSDVMRDTSRPVCSSPKKSSESDWRWSKTRTRRSRRKASPTRATSQIWRRPKTKPATARTT